MADGWEPVLEDLARRRAASRAMGGDERLAKHRGAGKLDARARVDVLLDAGSFHELGTLVGGDDAPADAIVTGSGRIDGRPVMVAAEDFTVKAGTIGAAANAKRYPRRRHRGRRPRAVGHDARGRRLSAPTATRHGARDTDRPARPGPVLRSRPAGDRGARPVGRSRRARRADLRLRGDEPARVDLHRRSAGRPRVDGRADLQGGPRRAGRRAGERTDPQRRRRRRHHPGVGARLPRLLPLVGVVVPGIDDRRRRRSATRPRDPRHRARQRTAHLRHAPGPRRRVRRRTPASRCSPGSARPSSAHWRASAGTRSPSSRTSRPPWPDRSPPTPPTRRPTSSPSPTRSTSR